MKRKFKFTKSAIESLPTSEKRTYFRDEKEPHLGLFVTPTGNKSFFAQIVVSRRTTRIVLGKFPGLSVPVAREKAIAAAHRVSQGIDPVAEKKRTKALSVTLRQVLDDYCADKTLKPGTILDYHNAIRESFSDWLDKPLARISEPMVRTRYLKRGKKSQARADNARRVLRALFNYARGRYKDAGGQSHFPNNPTSIISELKIGYTIQRRRRIVESDQMPTWWKAVQNLNDSPSKHSLVFILFTGVRRSEALNLKWQEVDLGRRTFTLKDTKNKQAVTLPLPATVATLLMPYPNKTGRVFEVKWPERAIRQVREESGIEFSPHDLRRSFISTANGLDISVYSVKALVNHVHSRNDVTAGYDIPDMERLRIASQKIEAALLRQVGCLSANVVHINR